MNIYFFKYIESRYLNTLLKYYKKFKRLFCNQFKIFFIVIRKIYSFLTNALLYYLFLYSDLTLENTITKNKKKYLNNFIFSSILG